MFGVGYKNGNLTSIGCSCKGKVWSRERADLQHFQEWCKEIGKIISDESIDTNIVLQNTLRFEQMSAFKQNSHPISMDWNPEVYEHYTLLVLFADKLLSLTKLN